MLKFGKFLMVGMVAAALGLFLPSCETDPDEPVDPQEYWATIVGGKIIDEETGIPYTADRIPFYADDLVEVEVFADDIPADQEFSSWTISPGSVTYVGSYGRYDNPTKFYMPTRDITITANFVDVEVDDSTDYWVTIVGGYIIDEETGEPYTSLRIPFYVNDPVEVEVYAEDVPDGEEFDSWTVSPGSVTFADGYDKYDNPTVFYMPARDITVTANFVPEGTIVEPPEELDTYVRFSWEAEEQHNIVKINASYDDVKTWYEEVYMAADYVEDDATDVPMGDGSRELPDNVYSSTIGTTEHKAVKGGGWFKITPSDFDFLYTAVCEVYDPLFDVYADVVANYLIVSSSLMPELADDDIPNPEEYVYTEIAFDIGTFLAGEDEGEGWLFDIYDNPDEDPMLEKKKAKKVKVIKKENVTYYILHRAKKV